jgi:CelD/BcsL family acetyltransferase involved in cellulose biosynthesis
MSWISPWNFGLESEDHFEVVTDIQDFKALRDDWDDLSGRSSQHRFSKSFVWCWTTWEAVEGPRGRRLHCMIGRNRSRLVLIWPFILHQKTFPFVATPLGCSYTEYPDPLVEDGPQADQRVETAWQTLRNTCGCDVIKLRYVREGSPLHHMLVSKMGRRAKIVSKVANHQVTRQHHENWINYFSDLPTKDRSEIKRRRRQLERCGSVTFEIVTGEECSPVIDWALTNKAEQLARTNRRGGRWLKTRAYRDLLVRAASQTSPHGQVIVFVL